MQNAESIFGEGGLDKLVRINDSRALRSVRRAFHQPQTPRQRWNSIKFCMVWIGVMAFCVAVWCLIFACISGRAHAEVYDSEAIADAIYVAEGGVKAKKPYGVLAVICSNHQECREICLNTIENTFTRWQAEGSQGDFLEVLARRYAPIGVKNDPGGLNRHWLGNVRYYLAKQENE